MPCNGVQSTAVQAQILLSAPRTYLQHSFWHLQGSCKDNKLQLPHQIFQQAVTAWHPATSQGFHKSPSWLAKEAGERMNVHGGDSSNTAHGYMIGIMRAKNNGLWPSLTSFHLFPRLYWSATWHCPGISTTLRVEGWGNYHRQDISSLATAFSLVDDGGKRVKNLKKPSQCHHYIHHLSSPTSSVHNSTFLITNLLLRNIIFPFLQK